MALVKIPQEKASERLVEAKKIILALPLGTEYYLRSLTSQLDINDPVSKSHGFAADRALTLLTSGEKLDVYSSEFSELADWMVYILDDITQEHIDKVKAL